MSSTKTFTAAEVAKHASKTDCYIIVNKKVYDATPFLKIHPGGAEIILDLAGKDATQDFEDVGHGKDALKELERLRVGTLQ